MSVYVDNMQCPFGRMIMCHMVADTSDELRQMAATIGVQGKWIQHASTYKEHFDISKSMRARAVAAGAVEITWHQYAEFIDARKAGSRWYPKNWTPGLEL